MKNITKPNFYEIAQDALGTYLTSEYGTRIEVYTDGSWNVGFASSINPNTVAEVKCPGMGNLDSTEFTDGFAEWDEEEDAYVTVGDSEVAGRVVGNLRELILECVEYGDVSRFTEDLQEKLENDYRNQMLSEADCD